MLWAVVGLPGGGKTTFFQLMTHKGKSGRTGKGWDIAAVRVPDPRVDKLVEIFEPRKISPAEIEFADTTVSVGVSGAVFSELQVADAFVYCIRVFDAGFGPPDPMRDFAELNSELALFDLALLDRKVENIEKSLRSAKSDIKHRFEREMAIVLELKKQIESGGSIREMKLDSSHLEIVANFGLLTAKPLVIVLSCDDSTYDDREKMNAKVAETYPSIPSLCIMTRTELELEEFDEGDEKIFREEFGLTEPVIDRFIMKAYDAAGIMTFFTCGEKEVHAWPIARGSTALDAAGKIHTDLARGFIRAEVVSYEDIVADGGWAGARSVGHLRLEGRDHVIHDGDTIVIKFAI